MKVVTADQMKSLDRRAIHERGLPRIVLMENAGTGATEAVLRRFPNLARKRVAVIAGRGNNGGDAFVIARHLINRDVRVNILLLADSVGKTGAAAMACRTAMRMGAGLVTLGIPSSLNEIMEVKLTETMTIPLPETKSRTLGLDAFHEIVEISQEMQALIMGPGISTVNETVQLVRKLIKALRIPMIIDADALTRPLC